MRILVDLQGAQTASRYRGIGRYSRALATALARHAGDHELWLLLNGGFPDGLTELIAVFEGLVPRERVRVWSPPGPTAEHEPGNLHRTRAAELVREHAAAEVRADVVLLTSLFEGYVDDGVTSVHLLDPTPTAVVLYDLIPLVDPEGYLSDPGVARYYSGKLEHLHRTDLLLAISEHSRREAIEALQVDSDRVRTISTAVDDNFAAPDGPAVELDALLGRLRVKRPYVMTAPGGFDPRKNIDGLVTAYADLPPGVRRSHQLVVASHTTPQDRDHLQRVVQQAGLAPDDVVLTDYLIDDELKALYAGSRLFVLPSFQEGFGLPALEAMACGAAVLGADATSVPEVVPWPEARFDPHDCGQMTQRMLEVLTDEALRRSLQEQGRAHAQTFSWDHTGRLALAALEELHARASALAPASAGRQRLALITPMPPERTGIATHSSRLLPELQNLYDVTVVTDAPEGEVRDGAERRSTAWFRRHGQSFERVVYQVGNSPFHTAALELLRLHPGVVVLHDFFLSGLLKYEEEHGGGTPWSDALLHSHGLRAFLERRETTKPDEVRDAWPANLDVLQRAERIVVHSEHARRLAEQFYGPGAADGWTVVPLLAPPPTRTRDEARTRLGLRDDEFVVCSFGLVDPAKQSLRLVDAFARSGLATSSTSVRLVLVGENHGGDYGRRVLDAAADSGRCTITGWVDDEQFQDWLAAADLAVQLRTASRGETSAAVLECLSHGVPTVVNTHGSMADLDPSAVLALPDAFSEQELVAALKQLHQDATLRSVLSEGARTLIARQHTPARCAELYAGVVEQSARERRRSLGHLVSSLALEITPNDLDAVAQAVTLSSRSYPSQRQLLVDVSTVSQSDLHSGIERVVRAQLIELLTHAPAGLRVEPVRLDVTGPSPKYRYARRYAARLVGAGDHDLDEPLIDVGAGDVYWCADYHPHGVLEAARSGLYDSWRFYGVRVAFSVYDLLPVLRPDFFPPGADEVHARYLRIVGQFGDVAVCISGSVANELAAWLNQNWLGGSRINVCAALLGSDLANSVPTSGLSVRDEAFLKVLKARRSFLIVGTVEPRKGHQDALAAFEILWSEGVDVQLVIVGKEGWRGLPDADRRGLPALVRRLRAHPERDARLHWLESASDELLERLYTSANCLLAPSEGEGFGLPLAEGARTGLPALARDLPVFREVAAAGTRFFAGGPAELAEAVRRWCVEPPARGPGATPQTWRDNVACALNILLPGWGQAH